MPPGIGYQGFQGDLGFTPQSGGFGGFAPQGGGGGLGSLLGATNPLVSAGLTAGGSFLGGLAGLLSGPSESQKRSRAVGNLAQNRLGQSVLDPQQYLAQYMQSLSPQFNQQAEGIGSRLGLDSGLAQKALAQGQQSTLSGILADLTRFNAAATAQQDLGLLNLQLRAAQSS